MKGPAISTIVTGTSIPKKHEPSQIATGLKNLKRSSWPE